MATKSKTAAQPKRRLRSAEMIYVRQILRGEARCIYCAARGDWLLGTGADPELEPHCHGHAADILRASADVIEGQIPPDAA